MCFSLLTCISSSSDKDEAVWCEGAGGCAVGGPTTVAGVTIIPGVELTVAQHELWVPDGTGFPSYCPRLTYL